MSLKLRQIFFLSIMIGVFFISKAESLLLEDSKMPQISTHDYGLYVYAMWTKNDGTNDIVQTAYSSNFGNAWSSPISLSESGQNALNPQVLDNYNQYCIYAIWSISDGIDNIIQFDASRDFFSSWVTPINLSSAGQIAPNPKFTVDDIGIYINALWLKFNGSNYIVQFVKSANFGKDFSSPIDLSETGEDALNLTVSSFRNWVCAIWQRSNGLNDIIQFRHSADSGDSWDSIVDLSAANQNAKTPEIKSKDFAIYAVWVRSDGSNDIVQYRFSIDNVTWSNVMNLSALGQNAKEPKIVAEDSGGYVHCSWIRSNGLNDIVQISSTYNFGATWTSPINLSSPGQNAKDVQMTTDHLGQNIYVIWTRSNGSNDIVQLSYSNDFGANWVVPIDLSTTGQNAKNPQIMTNFSGMNTYAIWAKSDGVKDVIQVSNSPFFGSSWSTPIIISN